jgi:hypothetical protein
MKKPFHPSTPENFSPELQQKISDNLYAGEELKKRVSEIIKKRDKNGIGSSE